MPVLASLKDSWDGHDLGVSFSLYSNDREKEGVWVETNSSIIHDVAISAIDNS